MRASQTCSNEGQMKKSSLVQNASSLYQNGTAVQKVRAHDERHSRESATTGVNFSRRTTKG